jgi:uncharacterized protein with WD repeat
MASGVDWDPTGRFVVTSVSAWRQKLETVRVVVVVVVVNALA